MRDKRSKLPLSPNPSPPPTQHPARRNQISYQPISNPFLRGSPPMIDDRGLALVPDRPGMGMDPDWEYIAAHCGNRGNQR